VAEAGRRQAGREKLTRQVVFGSRERTPEGAGACPLPPPVCSAQRSGWPSCARSRSSGSAGWRGDLARSSWSLLVQAGSSMTVTARKPW